MSRAATALAVVLALPLPACGVAGEPQQEPAGGEIYSARVTLSLEPLRPVNTRLRGQNVQWVDRGDGLLDEHGTFDERRLDAARELAPTVIRYPGGSNTDTYHWEAGRRTQVERGTSEHFHTREAQRVVFGTREFLQLCRWVGAEPLISVNTATGTPEQAAQWLAAIQAGEFMDYEGSGPLGPVAWWEIGNEPYLREDARPELGREPAESARRIDATIAALRAVDPEVRVGIPLRNDTLGTVAATPYPGYAETVLETVKQPFDFVALHNAYMPLLLDGGKGFSPQQIFAATMAASRVVEADLVATRALLARTHPGQRIPLAITEMNALFTIQGDRDEAIASTAGALFVADTLMLLAQADDVLMANYWSLSGNWFFGAIAQDGKPRPSFYMLHMLSSALRGDLLAAEVQAPSFDSPAVGIVPAYSGTPVLSVLATQHGSVVSLLLLNKDWSRPAHVTLVAGAGTVAGAPVRNVTSRVLRSVDPFDAQTLDGGSQRGSVQIDGAGFPLDFTLPPASLTLVQFSP